MKLYNTTIKINNVISFHIEFNANKIEDKLPLKKNKNK
jgi:hypothetical protein